MAALHSRKGIPRIVVPDLIGLPRPVIRAGLPCRHGVRDLPAVTRVGKKQVWVTRWMTDGLELPHGMDWLWYVAILAVATAAQANHRLRFQSLAEAQRLASQVGAGKCGTVLRKRMLDALRRLALARFGWAKAELGDGNMLASRQLMTEPILRISSALASVLWPDGYPAGAQIELDDSDLWLEPTVRHLAMALEAPFRVPTDIFRAMAGRPHLMSLALVIATYAQAASRPLVLGRTSWEIITNRLFQAPPRVKDAETISLPFGRVRERVLEAVAWLESACSQAGFAGAVKIFDPKVVNAYGYSVTRRTGQQIPERTEQKVNEPGRPRERWLLAISPAGPPFVRS